MADERVVYTLPLGLFFDTSPSAHTKLVCAYPADSLTRHRLVCSLMQDSMGRPHLSISQDAIGRFVVAGALTSHLTPDRPVVAGTIMGAPHLKVSRTGHVRVYFEH